MGLPNRVEDSVCRVVTCSFTKNRLAEFGSSRNSKNKCRSVRTSKEPESDLSDSHQSDEPRETQPVATSKNGIESSRIPKDINKEVRHELSRFDLQTPYLRVRFDDTPIFIESKQKVDEYNII